MLFYTIDTEAAGHYVPGDPEVTFDCPKKAMKEAHRALGSMAQFAQQNCDQRVLRAIVRDEAGQEVYVATVTFDGEWKTPPAA